MNNSNSSLLSKLRMYILFTLLIIIVGSLFYNKISTPSTKTEYIDNSAKELKNNSKTSLDQNESARSSFNTSIKLVVVADSHLNKDSFNKIKNILVESKNIDLLVHLGDHTDYGDLISLKEAKKELDSLAIPYIALPGDRDLAETSSEENFYKVFPNKTTLNIKGIKLTFFNNSRNFLPYPDSYIEDFITKIKGTDFLFTSQPIYVDKSNLFSQKYMGSTEAFPDLSGLAKSNLERYSSQRELILKSLRESEVKLIVSGDHHRSSEFQDSKNPKISYHIVGATAEKISLGKTELKQEALQTQRVSLIEVGTNKEFRITEIILNEK